MVDRLPGFYFGFQRVDKILLCQAFIFAQIYLLYQVLLGNHFAGDYVTGLGVEADVCLCEAALAQQLVLYLVSTVYHFHGCYFLDVRPLLLRLFTQHLNTQFI